MTSKGKETPNRMDRFRWLLVALILIACFVLNYLYADIVWAIRASIGILVVLILLLLIARTQQGRKGWGFVKGARAELSRVIWPTRQETVQTTFMVVVMVVVAAAFLWGVDSLFVRAVFWFVG